jgi:hypothetical protein
MKLEVIGLRLIAQKKCSHRKMASAAAIVAAIAPITVKNSVHLKMECGRAASWIVVVMAVCLRRSNSARAKTAGGLSAFHLVMSATSSSSDISSMRCLSESISL